MILAVCVDPKNGIRFNHRRQSRDRAVAEDLLSLCGGTLWLQPCSAALFGDAPQLCAAEDCLLRAPETALCFWENALPQTALPLLRGLVRYRWERVYPADTFFRFDPETAGMHLQSRTELQGFSHPVILREVYGYGE